MFDTVHIISVCKDGTSSILFLLFISLFAIAFFGQIFFNLKSSILKHLRYSGRDDMFVGYLNWHNLLHT